MSENLRLAETTNVPAFEECIKDESVKYTLDSLEVLQINVGRLCNLACKHCHVEAGPARTEIMSREVIVFRFAESVVLRRWISRVEHRR